MLAYQFGGNSAEQLDNGKVSNTRHRKMKRFSLRWNWD